jgi:hypothetical protein
MFESGAAGEEGLPELESAFDLIFSDVVHDNGGIGIGAVTVTADSDTAPYSYAWYDLADNSLVSTSQSLADVVGPKRYRVEITDVNSDVGRAYFTLYNDVVVIASQFLVQGESVRSAGSAPLNGLAKFNDPTVKLHSVLFLTELLTFNNYTTNIATVIAGLSVQNTGGVSRTLTGNYAQTVVIGHAVTNTAYAALFVSESQVSSLITAGASTTLAITTNAAPTINPTLVALELDEFKGDGDVELTVVWGNPVATATAAPTNDPVPIVGYLSNRPQIRIDSPTIIYRTEPL